LKQLQEAVESTLEQIGLGNDFLNRIQKAHHLIGQMRLHNKGISQQTQETAHIMGENLYQKLIL
jgi:hypothetical protein